MGRLEGSNELACLLVVCVSREGDVVHRHLQRKLLTRHGGDLIRLCHDVLKTAKSKQDQKCEGPFSVEKLDGVFTSSL